MGLDFRRKHPARLDRRAGYSGPAEGVAETHAGGQSGAEAAAATEAGGAVEGGDIGCGSYLTDQGVKQVHSRGKRHDSSRGEGKWTEAI